MSRFLRKILLFLYEYAFKTLNLFANMIHHIAVAKLDVHVHHSQINREYVLAAKVRRVRSSCIVYIKNTNRKHGCFLILKSATSTILYAL
jgi:hypothetical protein